VSKDKEVFESEFREFKTEEPWAPASIVVSALINPKQVYVARWKKKQIRFLSEVAAAIHLVATYLYTDVTWLEALVREYTRFGKFEDGWVIRQAVNIARGSSSRMLFNLARWKRIWYGAEPEPSEEMP
jgi:hypothetical protein